MIRWLKLIVHVLPCWVCAQTDTSTFGKRDLVDVYRSMVGKSAYTKAEQQKRDQNKLYFSLVPGFSSTGNSKGFVTAFVTAFYLGDKSTTNMSTVYFTPYFTFNNQYVLPIRSYIWSNHNTFNFTGDYRFMKYPQITYPLGAPSANQQQSLLDYYQVRFYQNATKEIIPNMAIGLGIQFDYYYNINQKEKYTEEMTDWEKYGDTALSDFTSSGLAFDLIYDTRGNTINPENGEFVRGTIRKNMTALGSTRNWSSFLLDLRKYFRLSKMRHKVIAVWGFYWTIIDKDKAGYLDLPSIGWDFYGHTGRGFYRNRFRSTGLAYAEMEYRTDISSNGLWGAVFFTNLAAPSIMYKQIYPSWYGSIGTGIRLKFDKRTGSNLLLDVGFSKDYWTWYIGLNEYF